MRDVFKAAALAASCLSGACAIMPDLPPDWALPMQEILLYSACELHFALEDMRGSADKSAFDTDNWNIVITLNPKIDADIQPGLGLTRKNPLTAGAQRVTTWVLGSGPGATLEMKGSRTGSVDFKFDSKTLRKNKFLPCDTASASYHSLAKHLNVADWLYRSIDAGARSGSHVDAPKFTAIVLMKLSGTGTYTYMFPPGSDIASLQGYYTLEEDLGIVFTSKPVVTGKFTVTTLPKAEAGFQTNKPVPPATVTILESQQITLEQIRQQLQNLKAVSQ